MTCDHARRRRRSAAFGRRSARRPPRGSAARDDRPADDEVAGAGRERAGRRSRPVLIALGVAGAADAGRDDGEPLAALRSDQRDLLRRGDDAVEAGRLRERGEPLDLTGDGAGDADLGEHRLVEAGQHRDRDDQRRRACRRCAASSSAASRAARIIVEPARGVDVDHPDAEPRRRADRAGDGVRDVVELQVEEHAVAARRPALRRTPARGW